LVQPENSKRKGFVRRRGAQKNRAENGRRMDKKQFDIYY